MKYIVESKGAEIESIPNGKVAPRMTPIHISAMYGHVDILVILASSSNIDIQDQVQYRVFVSALDF